MEQLGLWERVCEYLKAILWLGATLADHQKRLAELEKRVAEAEDRAPPRPTDEKLHAGIRWGRIPPDAEYRQAFCPACWGDGKWVLLELDTVRRGGKVQCICPTGEHSAPLITPEDVAAAGGPPLPATR